MSTAKMGIATSSVQSLAALGNSNDSHAKYAGTIAITDASVGATKMERVPPFPDLRCRIESQMPIGLETTGHAAATTTTARAAWSRKRCPAANIVASASSNCTACHTKNAVNRPCAFSSPIAGLTGK